MSIHYDYGTNNDKLHQLNNESKHYELKNFDPKLSKYLSDHYNLQFSLENPLIKNQAKLDMFIIKTFSQFKDSVNLELYAFNHLTKSNQYQSVAKRINDTTPNNYSITDWRCLLVVTKGLMLSNPYHKVAPKIQNYYTKLFNYCCRNYINQSHNKSRALGEIQKQVKKAKALKHKLISYY